MRIEGGRKEGGGGAACCWGLWWWLEKPFGCLELLCGSQLFELKLSTEGGRRRGSPSNILATQSARLSQQKSQRRRRRTWRQSEKERQRRWRRSSSRWGQQLLRAWRIVKVKKGSNLITTRIDTVFWQAIESAIEFIAHPSLSLSVSPLLRPCLCPLWFIWWRFYFFARFNRINKNEFNKLIRPTGKTFAWQVLQVPRPQHPYLPTYLPPSHTHSIPAAHFHSLSWYFLLCSTFSLASASWAPVASHSLLYSTLSPSLCPSLSHSAIYSLFAWLHLSCLLWTAL